MKARLRAICKNFPKKFWSLWFFCALVTLANNIVLYGVYAFLPPTGFLITFIFLNFFWAFIFYFLAAVTLRYWKWRGAFAFFAGIVAFVRTQVLLQGSESFNKVTRFGWYYQEDNSLGPGGYVDMLLNPATAFFFYAFYLFLRRYTRRWSRKRA